MSTRITYQSLFDLRLWHEYWLIEGGTPARSPLYYRVGDFLEIVPTANCQRLLNKYRWVFKQLDYGGSVQCSVDTRQNPAPTFIKVEERLQLDFIIKIKDVQFFNYSNLPFRDDQDLYLYFNNTSGSLAGANDDILFLTSPIRPYVPGNNYQIGDLVRENNLTYEVIDLPIQNPPGQGLTEWEESFDSQFVSGNDYLSFPGLNFVYKDRNGLIPPGTSGTFEINNIYGETVSLGFKNIPVEDPMQPIPFEQFNYPASSFSPFVHSLPLINIPDGYYELAPDIWEGRAFFKLDTRRYPFMAGLISILHIPQGDPGNTRIDDAFKILDDNSAPTKRRFNIYFKSRMTHWRYINTKTDPSAVVHTTPRPKAYSRITESPEIPVNGDSIPAPNPTPASIDVEESNNTRRYYSNIYIKV